MANALRLLKLPAEAAELVSAGKLSPGQVRPLLGLDTPEKINELARKAAEGGWSARIVEEVAKAEKAGKPWHLYLKTEEEMKKKKKTPGKKERKAPSSQNGTKAQDPDTRAFQEKLIQYLGTRVKIEPSQKDQGGRILIEYYGPEDLERLYELLQGPVRSGNRKKTGLFTV